MPFSNFILVIIALLYSLSKLFIILSCCSCDNFINLSYLSYFDTELCGTCPESGLEPELLIIFIIA